MKFLRFRYKAENFVLIGGIIFICSFMSVLTIPNLIVLMVGFGLFTRGLMILIKKHGEELSKESQNCLSKKKIEDE